MSEPKKAMLIRLNAGLISKAASWQHSLLTPWPNPDAEMVPAAFERYLHDMQDYLDAVREEAGIPALTTEHKP